MLLRTWRLIALMLTALSMATVFCHLMEMPAKLSYDGALWLTLLQTLYPRTFGTLGAFFEIGAIVATVALTFMVRKRRRALPWTAGAALCLIVADVAFWIWIAPVNAALVPLTPDRLPADWTVLRDQWEYTHASRALLQIGALAALLWSILIETPTDNRS